MARRNPKQPGKLRRRAFLTGAGGATLALPFLPSLLPREARAFPGDGPRFACFVRQANGVAQQWDGGGEPERFWPGQLGSINTQQFDNVDADKSTAELKDYASQLLMVRGVNFGFPGNGCGHSGGGNQCLTAARVSDVPSGNESLAMGESIDNRIANEFNTPGIDPMTLYAGKMNGYINEVLSYRGPMDLRPAERNPWNAYIDMVGLSGLDDDLAQLIYDRRLSVNDLVREQLEHVRSRPHLSSADRQRLDLHFDAVRDLEVELSCSLPPQSEIDELEEMQQHFAENDYMEDVVRLQMNVIALAFACEYTHAATLQIGDGNDSTEWWVNGEKQPSFHWISHRIFGDGDEGDDIPGAFELHTEIDRIHYRLFKHLLDRLSQYPGHSGPTLLSDCAAVMTNDLGNGPPHSYNNIPYVIGGSLGGYLRQGVYVDAGGVTNNMLFNTLLSGFHCREAGNYVTDFGDPELVQGVISEMIA